jgi:hypothetical protein
MDFEAMRAGLAHAIPYNEAGDTVAEVTVRWYVRKNS